MGWLNINGNWIGRHSGQKSWSSYCSSLNPDFWVKENARTGLALTDSVSSNNVSIKNATCSFLDIGDTVPTIKTGIIPDENTILIFRKRFLVLEDAKVEGDNTSLKFGTLAYSGGPLRWVLRWGDSIGYSQTGLFGDANRKADSDYHTFLVYDKRLWLLSADCDLSDSSINEYIDSTTPIINANTASWSISSTEIRLISNYAITLYTKEEVSLVFIGNLVGGVVTWQKKYIFNNDKCAYDIIGGAKAYYTNSDDEYFTDQEHNFPFVKTYNTYGYNLLSDGYSSAYNDLWGHISIPNKYDGTPITDVPYGYAYLDSINGDGNNHNMADSVLSFPAGSVWDRSNTDVFKQAARNRKYAILRVTGTNGTANITINGITEEITFVDNLGTSVVNFITASSSAYLSFATLYRKYRSIIIYSTSFNQIEAVSITNTSGDLNGVITYYGGYDSANPTDWHISELNRLLLNDWLEDDAMWRIFIKCLPNSVDVENKTKLLELVTFPENKTDVEVAKILKYLGDYYLIN